MWRVLVPLALFLSEQRHQSSKAIQSNSKHLKAALTVAGAALNCTVMHSSNSLETMRLALEYQQLTQVIEAGLSTMPLMHGCDPTYFWRRPDPLFLQQRSGRI